MNSRTKKELETKDRSVVVVGGGLAAQRCVEALRRRGYDGRLRMVCGEPELPYDRPPLSKGHLAGELSDEAVAFRSAAWYEEREIELILGRRAVRLEPRRRRVELDDGSELLYEDLVLATGAAPRRLPSLDTHANVHYLRTLADARGLRQELREGARLAVIGAGFIGQEVASTARAAGAEVTIVEALQAPLAGVLGEDIGRWLMKMHDEEGVDVRLSTKVEGARGNGSLEELVLSSGRPLACDVVVVGVGVAPDAGWLVGSGLEVDGVITDQAGRTSVPRVYAAGDVARAFDHRVGAHRRSEHWDGAARQGAAVARAIAGDEPEAPPLPSFWSDQYGLRIQYVGHGDTADGRRVDGSPGERDFAVVYTRGDRPVGALTVGRPRAYARLRGEIERSYEERTTDNGSKRRSEQ